LELTHHFHVPSAVNATWDHFQDVAGLAGCFPGAQVTSVDGDDFTGSCKVKLGPIALLYNGTGRFTQRDATDHRMVVEAKGKDKRGNGTAAATATLTMRATAGGGTDVAVVTELAITGKPAQFGRGLMQDVSDRLLGQFVDCLQQQMTPAEAAVGPDPGATDGPEAGPPPAPQPVQPSEPAPAPIPSSNDALDLGATVLPVLVKSYWKPAAAGALVVAVLVWLISR
jgi:carbon monoxide dehydrogenase subunit G